jgi:hypothetical protein
MSITNRLKRIERATGGGELPWLTYKQDLEDFDLWHNVNGDDTKTTTQLDDLAHRYNILRIEWDLDWRDDDQQ